MSRDTFDGELPQYLVYRAVSAALDEDLGLAGDVTTAAVVPAKASASAPAASATLYFSPLIASSLLIMLVLLKISSAFFTLARSPR